MPERSSPSDEDRACGLTTIPYSRAGRPVEEVALCDSLNA